MYIIFNIKHIYFLIFSDDVALYLSTSLSLTWSPPLVLYTLKLLRLLYTLILFVIDFIHLTIKRMK